MTKHCLFCGTTFSTRYNLYRHLTGNFCTAFFEMTPLVLHEKIEVMLKNATEKKEKPKTKCNVKDDIVSISIHPISQTSATHISVQRMRNLIEKYDTPNGKSKLSLLLSDYIRDIICNKDHPENHVVKYVRLKPPTFHVVSLNENGDVLASIKGIKDTCDVLTTPLFHLLKAKLKECLRSIKHDLTFDFDIYEEGIKNLKSDLNETIVKKVIGNILRYDIVNDPHMKFVK